MEKFYPGLDIQGCQRCQLLWFTQGQLQQVDLQTESFAEFSELQATVKLQQGTLCPECDIPLHFHQFPSAPNVIFAECYQCGGCYLSSSQVKEIRETQLSPEELETYRGKLAHSIDGFTQAEHTRLTRQGLSPLAKKWQSLRFWRKSKEEE